MRIITIAPKLKGLFTWRWGHQIGEVTCGGSLHLSCKRDQIKIRDYMDRRVTPTTWEAPPPCKQARKVTWIKESVFAIFGRD